VIARRAEVLGLATPPAEPVAAAPSPEPSPEPSPAVRQLLEEREPGLAAESRRASLFDLARTMDLLAVGKGVP
jgi:hypothetical protein